MHASDIGWVVVFYFVQALEMKREALEKAKKAVLHEKKQMEKAKAKIREIDAQVDPVLARSHPPEKGERKKTQKFDLRFYSSPGPTRCFPRASA